MRKIGSPTTIIDGVKHKTCPRCERFLSLAFFYRLASRPDSASVYCKDCNRIIKHKAYKKKLGNEIRTCLLCDKDFVRTGNRHVYCSKKCQRQIERASIYGLSIGDMQRLLERSNGCCEICQRPTEGLHIDHDHDTGVVRGLLCISCNTSLGVIERYEDRLMRYLARSGRNRLTWIQPKMQTAAPACGTVFGRV